MILGIDPSSLKETREAGARYFVDHKEVEPIAYMHDELGVCLMRLRLWMDPYDEKGRPYGGGTCDLPTFIELAKEGVAKGYKIYLDFHFSDFWCDPGKQYLPKAWAKLSYEELLVALPNYVRETLTEIGKAGIPLYAVQIGNEITGGMLWPIGKLYEESPGEPRKGYERLCPLLREAGKTVRELCPRAKILLHLERSYDQEVYREFFDHMVSEGVPFDLIGLSYYPYWHHSFDELFANIDMLRLRYGRPCWIVETSYGFTEDAVKFLDGVDWAPLVSKENDTVSEPFPLTQQGQADFVRTLIVLSKTHGVEAICYWEPFWLPLPSLTWATIEGETYVNETEKPTHNEWANQCLFDYEGNATLALSYYKVD